MDGVKIVVDCANGAAYDVAPKVFHELGAEIITCGISPNGFNINHECGVTNTKLQSKYGDGDRVLIIDENGHTIQGDQIIAALAYYLSRSGGIKNSIVVTTVISNLGLELYLKTIGITLIRTKVGDKHVVEKMHELGCNLGGEQSGHIIIGLNQATGDGIKAALQILAIYKEAKNIPISQLLNKFTPAPQFIQNIHYDHKIL